MRYEEISQENLEKYKEVILPSVYELYESWMQMEEEADADTDTDMDLGAYSDTDFLAVGACDGEEPVGAIVLELESYGLVHLRSIYVEPEHRRGKIGQKLIDTSLRVLRELVDWETAEMGTEKKSEADGSRTEEEREAEGQHLEEEREAEGQRLEEETGAFEMRLDVNYALTKAEAAQFEAFMRASGFSGIWEKEPKYLLCSEDLMGAKEIFAYQDTAMWNRVQIVSELTEREKTDFFEDIGHTYAPCFSAVLGAEDAREAVVLIEVMEEKAGESALLRLLLGETGEEEPERSLWCTMGRALLEVQKEFPKFSMYMNGNSERTVQVLDAICSERSRKFFCGYGWMDVELYREIAP